MLESWLQILSLNDNIHLSKCEKLRRIFLWEGSKLFHHQSTKYVPLIHPFDDLIKPLIKTVNR